MRRTTSISSMDSHLPFHSSPPGLHDCPKHRRNPSSTMTSPPLSQVIGFNPIPKCQTQQIASYKHATVALGTTAMLETQRETPHLLVSPRSALQTLLAASRQGLAMETAKLQPLNERATESNTQTMVRHLHLSDALVTHETGLQRSPPPRSDVQAGSKKKLAVDPVTQAEKGCTLEYPASNDLCPVQPSLLHYYSSTFNKSATALQLDGQETKHHQFPLLPKSPVVSDAPGMLPGLNFLDACHRCKRNLGQGLDIFMYRGDEAFCSVECRYQQILMDERNQRLSSINSRSSAIPNIPARHLRSFLAARTKVTA